MPSPTLAEDVQLAAGVIAARSRGDLGGAEQLLGAFDSDAARARAFWMLAELALGLVRTQTGQTTDELVRELALIVEVSEAPGGSR
ncbi:hypothetical protein [Sporichthya polymorpha]|uniref:hypothetical protein n=1 Tax=Sporichthya polymorpha TaxID=35751 RepID=UPI000363CC0A|nr:hypothetical protein [Sporichthya polymorpha]